MKTVIVESPLRAFMRPLLNYVEVLHDQHPGGFLTIVLPEFITAPLVGTIPPQPYSGHFDAGVQETPNIAVVMYPIC